MTFSVKNTDRILVIASMPDDIAVACGGFISKYKKQIDLLCIDFDPSSATLPAVQSVNISRKTYNEFVAIIQKANVNNAYIETSLDELNINSKDYNIILIPHKDDNNPKHQYIAGTLLRTLLEKCGCKNELQILRYELWNPMKEANYYEDITNYTESKKELIMSYKGSSPAFADGILTNNKFRTFTSSLCGVATHVEAFFIDDINAYLEKPDIINENSDEDFKNEELEGFLRKNNAQLKIDILAKRLQNKKIVLFGAGEFARCVFKNYDLSELNIIAIADKRFTEKRTHEFYGIDCVVPSELNNIDVDIILISTYDFVKFYDILTNTILDKNYTVKIEPLIQTDLSDFLKTECADKICTRPFHVLSIVPTGHCITCCPAYIKNFTIGNVFGESFESVWRGKRAQYLRDALIRNDYTTCDSNTCINLELADKSDIAKYYDSDGNPKMPDTIFMSWDYDCNVACITCRNKIIKNDENTLSSLQSIEKSVLDACKNAKYFYASGNGDPFGSSYARSIIKKITEINPQIKFLIHTNGILCNKKMCDELNITDKIKDITFSIHASHKETYNKIVRYGNFEKVLQNLEWISSLKSEGKIENINMVFVVHKLNYKDMPDFVRLAEKYNATASFRYYRQWTNNTEYNYEDMAVFEENHPEHSQFVEVLRDKIFDSTHCLLDPSLRLIHNS